MAISYEDYIKKKKKNNNNANITNLGSSNNTQKVNYSNQRKNTDQLINDYLKFKEEKIPTKTTLAATSKKEEEDKKWYQKIFTKGEFEDGVDGVGDFISKTTKTILGTATDVTKNVGQGVVSMVEIPVDIASNAVATGFNIAGKKDTAEKIRDFADFNLSKTYSERVANITPQGILYNAVNGDFEKVINPTGIEWDKDKNILENYKDNFSNIWLDDTKEENYEKSSVSGQYADEVARLVGYSLALMWGGGALSGATKTANIGTKTAGITANAGNIGLRLAGKTLNVPTLAIAGGMSGGLQEANSKEDVTEIERWTKGVSSGLIEGVTEGLFGFFGKAGTGGITNEAGEEIFDKFGQKFAEKFSTRAGKVLANLGVKSLGEPVEEFLSYTFNYFVDNNIIDKMGDADFSQKWDWGEVGEQMALAYASSLITQGGGNVIQSNSAIAEAEKQLGRKLTPQEKAEVTQASINGTLQEKATELEKKYNVQTETNETIQNSQETVEDIDNQIIALEQQLENTEDDAEYEKIRQQISELEDRANQLEQQEIAPVQMASTEQISQPTTQEVETNLPTDVVSNTLNNGNNIDNQINKEYNVNGGINEIFQRQGNEGNSNQNVENVGSREGTILRDNGILSTSNDNSTRGISETRTFDNEVGTEENRRKYLEYINNNLVEVDNDEINNLKKVAKELGLNLKTYNGTPDAPMLGTIEGSDIYLDINKYGDDYTLTDVFYHELLHNTKNNKTLYNSTEIKDLIKDFSKTTESNVSIEKYLKNKGLEPFFNEQDRKKIIEEIFADYTAKHLSNYNVDYSIPQEIEYRLNRVVDDSINELKINNKNSTETKTHEEDIAPIRQELAEMTQELVKTVKDTKKEVTKLNKELNEAKETIKELAEESKALTEADLPYIEQIQKEALNQDIAPIRKNLTEEESQELDILEDMPFDLSQEEQTRLEELQTAETNSFYLNDTTTLDKKSLKALSKNIKDSLDLNNKQRAELENAIQEYSMQELATKEDLHEIIESKFGKQSVEMKLDDVIDVQRAIKRTKIKPTDDLRQMTDYFQTKQKNFGRISMSNSGMEIDKVYQELSDEYRNFFPETITNPADQFERIIEVANMEKTLSEDIILPEETIQDITDFVYESVQDYKYAEYVKSSNAMYEDGWENLNIPISEEVNKEEIAPVLTVSKKVKPKQTTTKNVDWEALEDTSKGVQQQFNTETKQIEDTVEKKTKKQIKQELLRKTGIMNVSLDEANKIPKALMENTDPIRLQEMIFGRGLGSDINKMFFQKVKDNTSEKIRFQNKERAEIKDLGIKARSKESAAVQKYGEKQWTNDAGEVIPYGDKELASEFPNVETQKKIKKASEVIRQKYDSYLDTTNKVLTDLGYDAIPKRKDYMRHFQELNDIFSRVGIPYNYNEMTANDLPTDINGLTADFSPSKNFFASALRRKGLKTTYDAITGIDGYLEGIGNLIYHTEDIQRLRAYEQYIRDTYGENHGYDNFETLTDQEKATRIEKIQDNHLSNYAAWLHEYTNTLAGKKAMIDRSIESITGRRIYSFFNTTRSQVGKNMIGFNLSSAMTNAVAEVQALAKTSKLATVKGLGDTVKNIFVNDGFVEKNNFLTSRFGSEMLSKNLWQRMGDAGFIFMQGSDNFISQLVVRSKYNELKTKGYTDQQAHIEAGKFASRIMGDRSQGATANIYNSQMLGLVTQFQLEVNNQLYSMFYDTYHESKEQAQGKALKTAAGMTYTLGQLAIFTHLFGAGFEKLAGYNPTFDIIGMLMTAFGLDDEEDSEDTTADNIGQAFEKLGNSLPYMSILNGGRIPISEALPFKEMFTGKDEYGNDKSRVKTFLETLPYYAFPSGYGQIKKTTKGLGMYDEDLPIAGSYTDSGNLRFTAKEDTWSKVQAAIFGQWANEEAQAYVDSEFKTIHKDNVDELIDLGMTSSEYREYRNGLSKQKSIEDKIEYINDLDVTDEQKSIMANNVLKRDYDVDMSEYDDFGSYEEFDYSYKNPEKYEWFKENGISYEDYSYNDDSKKIYNYAFNNPEVYKTGKAITDDFEDYMEYRDYIYDLKADKDSEGKSISGTRKTKVISYVNSLDLSIPQKAMLIRQEYSTFNDYNYDIVEYVNSLDIEYEDKVSILESLEMKVSEDGTISWE